MVHFSKTVAAVSGVALLAFAGIIVAQNPGLTRTIVTKADVSVPGREAVVARVEVAPGGVAGWHTHPGDEISYVTEGEATLMVAGQPPRKVAAGDAFVIPPRRYCTTRRTMARQPPSSSASVVEKGQAARIARASPGAIAALDETEVERAVRRCAARQIVTQHLAASPRQLQQRLASTRIEVHRRRSSRAYGEVVDFDGVVGRAAAGLRTPSAYE